MWIVWFLIAIVGIVVLGCLFVWAQFRRYRRNVPNPAYKSPNMAPSPSTWNNDEMTFTWIGHSTVLMNVLGYKIITDPVFSERVGVRAAFWTVGPRRHTAPALQIHEVGKVDLILLSHAHLDHFDLPSLRRLAGPDVDVVVPRNTGRLLRRFGFRAVHEIGAGETLTIGPNVTISTVPVRHWGARFPWNKEYEWTGYVIEHRTSRLFFAGDTAYTDNFKTLREGGPIDVAFIPIGAYAPDTFQRSHCTPEQAWAMFQDSGAKWLVPIHYDTFVLSQEPVDEPLKRLLAAAGPEADRVVIQQHGDTFRLPVLATVT